MRGVRGNEKLAAATALLLLSTPLTAQAATAATSVHGSYSHSSLHHTSYHSHHYYHSYRLSHNAAYHSSYGYSSYHFSPYRYGSYHYSRYHYSSHYSHYRVAYYHGIQCVAFAKADSGIILRGNAADWWQNAAGVYQRGDAPEVGAVLNFRANPRMRLGHVAVVSNVIDARTVEIDQANWGGGSSYHGGRVTRSTMVVDVSPNNDWTAVRVGARPRRRLWLDLPDLRLHL